MLKLGLKSLKEVISESKENIVIYNHYALPDIEVLRRAYDGSVYFIKGWKGEEIIEDNTALGRSKALSII